MKKIFARPQSILVVLGFVLEAIVKVYKIGGHKGLLKKENWKKALADDIRLTDHSIDLYVERVYKAFGS